MTGHHRQSRPVVRTTIALVLLLVASAPILAMDEPPEASDHLPALTPISATYGATMDKGLSINGSATRTLEQQPDGSWLYRFDVNSFIADITESVTFNWKNGHIQPLKYRYALKGLMIRNRSRALNFNHTANTVSGSYEGESFNMPLMEGALDPLGFQLQLQQDLKAGKKDVTYAVADDGDFDEDRFAVIGEETQDTPFGEQRTVKVEKVRDADSKRSTLMWFAPELDYLLVRLVQVEPDGSRYEVNLKDADLAAP
ncbi:DUF3108 domain-containing protein [Marinobacter sp. M1N3S26]|uniref:DUF3108 domain-containing protein n=1 Tax=unclassified Marinobacter TaxID=83889 RepID=UPI00387AFE22